MSIDTFHVIAAPTGNTLAMRIEASFAQNDVITVTELPSSGQVLLADGSSVEIGDMLTGEALAGLRYETGAEPGTGHFGYSVESGEQTLNGVVGLTTTGEGSGPPLLYFAGTGTNEDGRFINTVHVVEGANGTPQQVKTIDGEDVSGFGFTELGGQFFFYGSSPSSAGLKLFRIDPENPQQAEIFVDVRVSALNLTPPSFAEFDGAIFFVGDDADGNRQVYRLDEGAEEPVLLSLYNPQNQTLDILYGGPTSSADITFLGGGSGTNPVGLTAVGGRLLFQANSVDSNGNVTGAELFAIESATAEPQLLADINPGQPGSFPVGFIEFDGAVFFSAETGEIGRQLFRLDEGSTTPVLIELNVYLDRLWQSNPVEFTIFEGSLYFQASTQINAVELFRLDGATGTPELIDIAPGVAPSYPTKFVEFDGGLYFVAWTPEGATEIFKIGSGTTEPQQVTDFGTNVFTRPPQMAEFDGSLYFASDDRGGNGEELWRLDTGSDAPVFVADIVPGTGGSQPRSFIVYDGALFFIAFTAGDYQELYRLDGGATTPVKLTDMPTLPGIENFLNISVFNNYGPDHPTIFQGTGAPLPKGTDGDDTLIGNAAGNIIEGRAGNDILQGGDGKDYLVGGEGADDMAGGDGNDIYAVDDLGDSVEEASGEGDDIIYTSVSYHVPVNVEVLIMEGTAGITATGSDERNILLGNVGNNLIDGAGGFDVMAGGMGDDTYFVDHSYDAVVEGTGEGIDTLYSSVDFIIDAAQEIETAILNGPATILRGSDSDNQLFGNDQVNVIDGRGGTDFMLGFGGADIFQINLEAGAVDVIGDFSKAEGDRIAFTGFNQATTLVNQASLTSFEVRDTKGTSTLDDDTVQTFILNDSYGSGTYIQGQLEFGVDYYFG